MITTNMTVCVRLKSVSELTWWLAHFLNETNSDKANLVGDEFIDEFLTALKEEFEGVSNDDFSAFNEFDLAIQIKRLKYLVKKSIICIIFKDSTQLSEKEKEELIFLEKILSDDNYRNTLITAIELIFQRNTDRANSDKADPTSPIKKKIIEEYSSLIKLILNGSLESIQNKIKELCIKSKSPSPTTHCSTSGSQ